MPDHLFSFSPTLDTKRQFGRLMKVIFVLFTLMVLFSCSVYSWIVLRRNDQYVERITEQCRANIIAQSEEMRRFVQTAAYNDAVISYFGETDAYRRYALSKEINNLFTSMRMINKDVEDIFLFPFGREENTFASIAGSQNEILRLIKQNTSPAVLNVYPYHAAGGRETIPVLLVGCGVFDVTDQTAFAPSTLSPVGSVVAAFNLDAISRAFEDIVDLDGISLAILNSEWKSIYSQPENPDEALLAQVRAQADQGDMVSVGTFVQYIISVPVEGMNCTLLILVDRLAILGDLLLMTGITALVAVCILLSVNAFFRAMRRQITGPLTRLTHTIEMRSLQEKPDNDVLPEEGNRDIRILTQQLNSMFERERQLIDQLLGATTKLYESKLAQNRLELQFLRSQINPHFLYNTLETIRSIAVVRHMPQLANMAKSLAKILRYSIKGEHTVPLKDELEIITCYLSIQNTRFPGRFSTSMDMDEDVLTLPIPRMCLQPLVENAVMHGLENMLTPGRLEIACKKEAGGVRIRVSDNGAGIPEDKLEEINRMLKNPMQAQSASVGLMNVARRLQIAVGEAFYMQVISELGKGTTVVAVIPIEASAPKQDRREELMG